MAAYILSRIGRAILTILLVLTFSFTILASTGDPAPLIMSVDAPPETIEAFRKQYGLDAPVWQQFLGYLRNLAEGNMGKSLRDGRNAWAVVVERIPMTLAITVPAFALKIGLGVPTGIYAALHRNSCADRVVMMVLVAGYTVTSFVLALLLVLVSAVKLGWLPSDGYETWRHAIPPVITLGTAGAAIIARYTRSAMLDVLGQPYIRTGRVKGLHWSTVVRRHALPNAAIPTVTVIGFMLGSLIAGAVVVESVFAWPGVGWLLAMIAVALLADLLRPYDFKAMDLRGRLTPPIFLGGTTRHLLGSDELGRDVISRLIESVRVSLAIAFLSTLIAATIGITLGFLAAHFRGAIEQIILALVDLQASMPFLIIALAVLAFFGNTLTLFVLLMGFHGRERIARISRGLAIAANEQGYAAAGRDLGVQPPLTSLGNMVGYGRDYMGTAPWILLAPAVVIVLTALSISMLGDWLRDRLDPTLR